MEQRRHRHAHGVPQRRPSRRQQLVSQDGVQRLPVAREVARIEQDHVGKAADARLVRRQEPIDERRRRLLDQRGVLQHAEAAVEHHDDRDRLHVAGKGRDRLERAVVVDLEGLFLRSRTIRPAASVTVTYTATVEAPLLNGIFSCAMSVPAAAAAQTMTLPMTPPMPRAAVIGRPGRAALCRAARWWLSAGDHGHAVDQHVVHADRQLIRLARRSPGR